MRRADNPRLSHGHASHDSALDSNEMTDQDSASSIQSAAAQLDTIIDETAGSSLQAIHNLTPRLANLSSTGVINNTASGGPMFPVLDS